METRRQKPHSEMVRHTAAPHTGLQTTSLWDRAHLHHRGLSDLAPFFSLCPLTRMHLLQFALVRPVLEELQEKEISYVEAYGQGQFDGQSSGHDFYGVRFCLSLCSCICAMSTACARE